MLLTLHTSSAYPIPPVLETHDLPQPTLPTPRELKVPLAYTKAKRALSDVGLQLPHFLAADRALWWHFAVKEIVWDLEEEQVEVTFLDGSEERWELGGADGTKSVDIITDSLEEAEASGPEAEERSLPAARKVDGGARGPWAPSTVLEQLHRFCVELRSAYEDLGTSRSQEALAPDISTDSDFQQLMLLAADPGRELPFEWTDAKSLYEYAMKGVSEEEDGKERETDEPSQTAPTVPSSGEFVSRRRPRRLSETSVDKAARVPHDFLSLIDLLSRVRQYLADLFSHTILPKLREELPPTYSLWAADSAIIYCRREAVKRSGEAAQLILDLLDDEGDELEDSQQDQLEPDIAVFSDSSSMDLDFDGGGDSYGIVTRDGGEGGGGLYSHWLLEEKRQKYLSDNPLAALKDDFAIRCWCEQALERARELARDEWLTPSTKPAMAPVSPWPVSLPVDGDESDFDEPSVSGKRRSRPRAFDVPLSAKPKTLTGAYASPPTSPPGDDDDPFSALALVPALEPSSGDSDETDADVDEPMDDPPLSLRMYSPAFFYPENLVKEKLLPPRLPKEVVIANKDRGKEMERQRRDLHDKLNEVAGLQKKLFELQRFVENETDTWEEAREKEKEEKEPTPPTSSGLRKAGASSISPPPPEPSKHDLPLKAQPLRKQAADKALSVKLSAALGALEPSAKARNGLIKQLKPPIIRPSSPAPRKRQKHNLVEYSKVLAITANPRAGPLGDKAGSSSSAKEKKRKRSIEAKSPASACDAAEGADDEGPARKRGRKAFTPKRKSVNVRRPNASASPATRQGDTSSVSDALVLVSDATSAATITGVDLDARHRAVLELSNRRRPGLEAAGAERAWPAPGGQRDNEEDDLDIRPPWAIGNDEAQDDDAALAYDDEDEDGEGGGEETEAMLQDGDDEDGELEPTVEPLWGSFPARTPSPIAALVPKEEEHPPARAPSSFPKSFSSSHNSLTLVTPSFPTSSTRAEPAAFLPVDPADRRAATSVPSLVAPGPIRPFAFPPLGDLSEEETVDEPVSPPEDEDEDEDSPSPSMSSGSSQQGGLAQRLRDTLAVAASPPNVRLVETAKPDHAAQDASVAAKHEEN
ncbi:hypothetical protein JCM10213_006810 [Rhodosporidiobolus nylandii]